MTTKQGLPVTRPARTLIDVAGSESPRRFNWIVEQARSRRLVSDTSLREAIGRAPSGHGPAVVRAHTCAQSPNRPLRVLMENADCSSYCGRLVCPSQESTRSRGGKLTSGGLRNALPSSSTGWDGHRSRDAFERDSAKQSQLAAVGIQLARVTGRRLRDQPYAVIAETAAALNVG